MGIPLYVICCFSFAALSIFSLSLIFISLINMCLSVFFPGFVLCETPYAPWIWVTFLSYVREIFSYLIRYFLCLFLSHFCSTGFRVAVFLASAVCPLVDEV